MAIDLFKLLGLTSFYIAPAPSSLPPRPCPQDNTVTIDLFKLLGLTSFYAGVAWDPVGCMPPYKVVWPNITDEESKLAVGRLAAEMRAALAEIKGVDAEVWTCGAGLRRCGHVDVRGTDGGEAAEREGVEALEGVARR
eukprot:361024-Chlamydomonas_euryale.AAC.3